MGPGRQRGFTLVETLAAVAIVVILLGISAVGVVYYARWLKITELDNAAREIYLAAENRAVLLSGSGRLEKLVAARGTGMTVTLASGPEGTQTAPGYYIYHSGENELAGLLPAGTLDPALMEGSFYIVYEPEGGSVTDVFYAEDSLGSGESAEDFQKFYREVSTSSRSARMRMEPMVGYYGGGTAENAKDDALGTPIVTIKNEETLTAEITYAVLPSVADKTALTVKLAYDGCEADISPDPAGFSREEKDGRVRFTCSILLDSLDRRHFRDLFLSANGPRSFGGDFTVTATLTAPGATPSSGSDTDNSLFAEGSGGETAYIANLRHLQNLNEGTSGVRGKTAAVQNCDIDCAAYLGENYTFTPIDNTGLTSYNGSKYILRGLSARGDNAGLFARVYGTPGQPWRFQNIRMVNASAEAWGGVKSIAAGALVGIAADASLENCRVYWEPETGAAGLRSVLGDDKEGYRYQITGGSAGGLAGQLTGGSITDCLAATLVQGKTVAGGLVGQAIGAVEITGSYADCYLSGGSAGGLVGISEKLDLKNCYAAGFTEVTGDNGQAAGLCTAGTVAGERVYSAVRSGAGKPEPLAPNMEGNNCYYLSSAMGSGADSRAKTYTEMKSEAFAGELGPGFARKERADSHPYNLRTDLALTVYDFPGLAGLPHYGDWSAQFTEASLVYYEQYPGNEYGFYGGGVDALENRHPVKDGYAVAVQQETETSLTVTINDKEYPYKTEDLYPVTGADGTKYLLAPLPDELVNTKTVSKDFYQPLILTVDGETNQYYYCPHFAKTAEKTDTMPPAPAGISVRTPRHLYMLSLYPDYFNARYTFHQELELDYARYTGYGLFSAGFTQVPIGRSDQPFNGVYDGGCRAIKNLVFRPLANTTRAYAGLFGYSSGTLRDIVYLMDAGKQNTVSLGSHRNLYIGGLAGGNAGSVVNCAVAGASLTGNAYTAAIYIGGLVGLNQGEITRSAAECAALAADTSSYASAYVGGLAGHNATSGVITASYAVGRASAEADATSGARVCGFVGYNQGSVRSSYAAMDLKSSGKAVETYGFCGVTDGLQNGTCFLNMGNFTYRDISYNASYTPRRAKEINYAELTDRKAVPVAGMSFVEVESGAFPYPTAVRNAAGQPVHYGQWPEQMRMGVMGVYYWERLRIGGTDTYHVSLLAADPKAETITRHTTLSNAHSDGGVVEDYGYGYYFEKGSAKVTLTANGIYYSKSGGKGNTFSAGDAEEDDAANKNLAALMPGYEFHSYHSFGTEKAGGGLYPTGEPNGTFQLMQGDISASFTVNPHFAAALSVAALPKGWKFAGGASTDVPGSEKHPYEVRAVSQLQNINWNSTNCDAHTVLTAGARTQFPYLSYLPNNGNAVVRKYCWNQTHNLKGETGETYTPIAEYYDDTADAYGNLRGWFGGIYNGRDYLIENVSIKGGQHGPSSAAGLFGVVYNGRLSHINLCSSDGAGRIEGSYDIGTYGKTRVWTAIGGLAGIAASNSEDVIDNCSVAGYTIAANFMHVKTGGGNWGGAEIGGLVGITNRDLRSCSAVTDIVFEKIDSNDNVRVGGLAGSAIGTIENCYAGGTISFAKNSNIAFSAGKIYIGGIVGGAYFKPMKVGEYTIGPSLKENGHSEEWDSTIKNCYSYVELPALKTNGYIKSLYAIGGTGELNPSNPNQAQRTYDGKQDHGECTIENSYYLNPGVLKDSYDTLVTEAKNDPTTKAPNPVVYPFRTDVDKAGVTAVTYARLAGDELIQQLNQGKDGPFSRVTAQTDDGYSVAGKYSYPSAESLKGLNYPFPTILVREGNHVHYGDWPVIGIRRGSGGAPIELDLFAQSEHIETLGISGVPDSGAWSAVSGNEKIAKAECKDGKLNVTGTGVGVTEVTVTYAVDGERYTLTLSVNVTAVLELRTAKSLVRLFTNDTVSVPLTAYGRGGSSKLDLDALNVAVEAGTGVYDSKMLNTAEVNNDDLALRLATGGMGGDTTVSINYTYIYCGASYTGMSAITFQVAAPEIKTGENKTTRLVTFEGGHITTAKVTEGRAEIKVDPASDTVSLDMKNVPPGTAVTVEVALKMDELDHMVTVTVTAEDGGS